MGAVKHNMLCMEGVESCVYVVDNLLGRRWLKGLQGLVDMPCERGFSAVLRNYFCPRVGDVIRVAVFLFAAWSRRQFALECDALAV